MNPEQAKVHLRSRAARFLASTRFLEIARGRARLERKLRGGPATVHYFHQVDDPYSHLAVQKLDALRAGYSLPFEVHLVSQTPPEYQGNEERFASWAMRDAQSIASAYGTRLEIAGPPSAEAVAAANQRLAPLVDTPDFAKVAFETGEALWAGPLASSEADMTRGEDAVRDGDALREKLGHYLGAMFYFEGEWFWGVDRIRSLERRLIEEGFSRNAKTMLVPEPTVAKTSTPSAAAITLEYFPSLRSPYTAVGHAAVLDLIARTGVTVSLRPVMPMMMRGVPAPFPKQRYIITDAAREARERGVPFGHIVDPIGYPVKKAFALFPAAVSLGRGMEFITAYLSAAWAEGTDIASEAGLRQVVESAGLDWHAVQDAAEGNDWEALLEDNVNAMLDAGLWGVPSFRVSGGAAPDAFACWGQDRIWRVEQEILTRVRPQA